MMTTVTLLAQAQGLTAGGIVVMAVSITFVLSLCIFCIRRVFQEPEVKEHMHAPLDIDTHDTE